MFSISHKEQFLRLKESARGIFTTGPSFSKAGRITLSTGWINHYPVDSAIGFPNTYPRWIVIYPVNTAIQRLNNWSQVLTRPRT